MARLYCSYASQPGFSTSKEVHELAAVGTLPPLGQLEKKEITELFTSNAQQNAFYCGVF